MSTVPPVIAPPAGTPPAVPPAGTTTPPVSTTPPTVTPPVVPPPAEVVYQFDKVKGYPDSEVARVTAYAKEMGLDPEAAKKLHAADVKAWNKDIAAIEQENAQQRAAWQEKNKADTDFGGPKFTESEAKIKEVMSRFDPDGALARDLEVFGLKDQPNMFKFLARMGAAMTDGKFVIAPTVKPEKPLHERLYPAAS